MNYIFPPPVGQDLLINFGGYLRRFRITRDYYTDGEILTLANLDNGYVRKFIVKRVDEQALLASIRKNEIKDENESAEIDSGIDEKDTPSPDVMVSPDQQLNTSQEGVKNIAYVKPLSNGSIPGKKKNEADSSTPLPYDKSSNSSDEDEKTPLGKDSSGVVNLAFNSDEDTIKGSGRASSDEDSCDSYSEINTRFNRGRSPRPSPRSSPRHSPISYRSCGNMSHRSSVSSVRKGILKKSSSSTTINMEMNNLSNGYGSDNDDDSSMHSYGTKFGDNRFSSSHRSLGGGNRVKFILDSGRPDKVTGDFSDCKLERKPTKIRDLQILENGCTLNREKEPEDESSGSSRKCLLFCVGVIIVSIIIIIAGIFGSGKFRVSSSSGGIGIVQLPKPSYLNDVIEILFNTTSSHYTAELADNSTVEFQSLAKEISEELAKLFLTEEIRNNGYAKFNYSVVKFEPGVKTTFRIGWIFNQPDTFPPPPLNVSVVRNSIEARVVNSSVHLGDHIIPWKSLTVERLKDYCKEPFKICSDVCTYDREWLKFKCSCNHNFVLRNNTCVDPALESPPKDSLKDIIERVKNAAGTTGEIVITVEEYKPETEDTVHEAEKSSASDEKEAEKKDEQLYSNQTSSNNTFIDTNTFIDPGFGVLSNATLDGVSNKTSGINSSSTTVATETAHNISIDVSSESPVTISSISVSPVNVTNILVDSANETLTVSSTLPTTDSQRSNDSISSPPKQEANVNIITTSPLPVVTTSSSSSNSSTTATDVSVSDVATNITVIDKENKTAINIIVFSTTTLSADLPSVTSNATELLSSSTAPAHETTHISNTTTSSLFKLNASKSSESNIEAIIGIISTPAYNDSVTGVGNHTYMNNAVDNIHTTKSKPASSLETAIITSSTTLSSTATSPEIISSVTTSSTTTHIPEIRRPCAKEEFECINGTSPSGHCIKHSARCDSIPDCSDGSDERNCEEEKCFGNFQCWNGNCIARTLVCDGVMNCGDEDDRNDETGCSTWKCREDEFKCEDSVSSYCIPSYKRCDGHVDCVSNHADEFNCSTECAVDHFLCPEGWCIPQSWKCDGKQDCLGGEDEQSCSCSSIDEIECEVGGCFPMYQLCDGLRQCPDGSDEWNCLRIDSETRRLEIRKKPPDTWFSVCSESWTSKWSDLVCEQMGGGVSLSTEISRVQENVPSQRVKLKNDASPRTKTPMQFALVDDVCPDDPLVHLSCSNPVCGSWQVDVHEGENIQKPWPSIGVLLFNKTQNLFCTATILSPTWVITSYSCLASKDSSLDSDKWVLFVNSKKKNFYHITKIVKYPGVKKVGVIWNADAVVLRLDAPLKEEETTSPVCLPETVRPSEQKCVLIRWTDRGNNVSQWNHSVRTVSKLELESKNCEKKFQFNQLSIRDLCAEFNDPAGIHCRDYKGSPLYCQGISGLWHLEGIVSHLQGCGRKQQQIVLTSPLSIQYWIGNSTGMLPKLLATKNEALPIVSEAVAIEHKSDEAVHIESSGFELRE